MLDHPNLTIMGSSKQQSTSSNSSTSHSPSHDPQNPTLCSAYSPAAKATEDWTTIEDRTERRRIQNRIAQRAYRQKLKERLQHLERKAASSTTSSGSSHSGSPSPESQHRRIAQSSEPEYSSQQSQSWSLSPPETYYSFDEANMPPYYASTSNPVLHFGGAPAAFEDQPHIHHNHHHHQTLDPYFLQQQNTDPALTFNASPLYDENLSMYPELDTYGNIGYQGFEQMMRS